MAKISVSVASPSEVVRKSIPCGEKIIDDRFQVSIQGLTKRSIIQVHGFCLRHSGFRIPTEPVDTLVPSTGHPQQYFSNLAIVRFIHRYAKLYTPKDLHQGIGF